MKGHDDGDLPLRRRYGTRESVVRVDNVEPATAKRPAKLQAGLGIRLLASAAVEGEDVNV
jgi:hypothetical protein